MRRNVALAALSGLLGISNIASADPPVIESIEVRGEGERVEVAVRGQFEIPTYAVRPLSLIHISRCRPPTHRMPLAPPHH